MEPTPIATLVESLQALGVQPGDTLMVHASLRELGPTERRGAGVIEALDGAVGPGGTWMMVLGAEDPHAFVNERPEGEREALLESAVPFDAWRTPALPEVGTLAELMRQHDGTLVSDHPEGRFAARGAAARALTEHPPWNDYYGPGSALERLLARGGKILRLGADLETVTFLHYAEFLCEVPNKRRVRRHRLVSTPRGPQVRVVETLDDEHGIVDFPGPDDPFALLTAEYLATGRARTGVVGAATAELIEAADLLAFAVPWMNAHFARGAAATAR